MRFSRAILVALVIIVIVSGVVVFEHVFTSGFTGSGRVVLRGAGATFLQPQLEAWIEAFMEEYEDIVIEYSGIGSGAGQKQFFRGLVDFCGSDPPLSRSRWEEYRGGVLQLPVILGALAVVYNVPDIPRGVHLNLTGRVLALIYLGEIRFWDDPRILELNPAIADKLPHKEIIAVHRSDSSGSTQIFTTFLHKAAPDIWPKKLVGKVVDWPVDKVGNGVGAIGNAGVTATVVNTEYSIGYVELAYVIKNNLQVAAVMNREGYFTLPTVESIQSVAMYVLKAGILPSKPDGDFSREFEAIVYAGGRNSYPITAFSHIFVWRSYDNVEKARAIKRFLEWLYNNDSKYIVEGYVPLPVEVKKLWMEAVKMIEE